MNKMKCGGWIACSLFLFGATAAFAQGYPARAIRFMAPEPGGNSDIVARTIAQGIAAAGTLGQPFVIENRPSNLIGDAVARSAADGYTIAITGAPTWINPLLQKTPYDPIKDLSPIVWVTSAYHVLLVNPSVPVKSVKELIAFARQHPGEINYSSGPNGSESNLASELLKSMTGIDIVRVIYKGAGPASIAVASGETSLMFQSLSQAMIQVRSGRVKALGIAKLEPSLLAPELPTLSATGLPGFEMSTDSGVFGPGGLPAPIVDQLNQAFNVALARPDVKGKLSSLGAEVVGGSPSKFGERIRSEISKWGKVIKSAGIQVN